MQKEIKVNRTAEGKMRVYGQFNGYGTKEKPSRVWVATHSISPLAPIYADTILVIKDAAGNVDEVLTGEAGVLFG